MSGGVGGCPTRSNKRSRSGSCDKARSETARYRVNHAKISKYTHSYLLCDRSNRANPCRVSFLLSLSFQQQPCETSVENPRFSAKSGPTIRPSPCVWPMNSHPRPPARVSSSSSCSSCSSWPRLRHLLRPQAPLQPQDGPGLAPAMRHGQRGCGEGELLAASVSRQTIANRPGIAVRETSAISLSYAGTRRTARRPDQAGPDREPGRPDRTGQLESKRRWEHPSSSRVGSSLSPLLPIPNPAGTARIPPQYHSSNVAEPNLGGTASPQGTHQTPTSLHTRTPVSPTCPPRIMSPVR